MQRQELVHMESCLVVLVRLKGRSHLQQLVVPCCSTDKFCVLYCCTETCSMTIESVTVCINRVNQFQHLSHNADASSRLEPVGNQGFPFPRQSPNQVDGSSTGRYSNLYFHSRSVHMYSGDPNKRVVGMGAHFY